MTRGLGKLQRAILMAVDELGGAATVMELARHVTGRDIAVRESEYESVRQAVRALRRRGVLRQRGHRPVVYDDGVSAVHKLFCRADGK